MPYYCQFNGTGYLTAPTLGNLLTANKIRVVIKRLKVVGDGFIFSQSGAGSTREFGVLYSGGSLNYIYGSSTERAILTTAETSSNFGSGGYFDLTFDNTANTVVLRNDVGETIKSVSLVKGGSRIDGVLFRLGARCGNDTTDTSGGFIAANGTWIGDVAIYINDVLVRNYITPSTGTAIPDSVGGNDLTQRGTWPAGDGEWVFYSSGASNTITVSATLPKITGSLTLNEINPSYVISVNGQLPKLTGAVVLNEINPTFTVAVAGQLPKLTGSIALNQFANNRQVAVSGVLPKLTGAVTLNRLQPNNQVAVSGQLPRLTASITLNVPGSYPAANPNDYTVSAYVSAGSAYTATLSASSTINAMISTETTYAARLN